MSKASTFLEKTELVKDDKFWNSIPDYSDLHNKSHEDFWHSLPLAKEKVDGLVVRKEIPNKYSIEGFYNDYIELKGVREIPMREFGDVKTSSYSPSETNRIKKLAQDIKNSGEINPLIIGIESDGPVVIEGGHRLSALALLGKKKFPALVVIEED